MVKFNNPTKEDGDNKTTTIMDGANQAITRVGASQATTTIMDGASQAITKAGASREEIIVVGLNKIQTTVGETATTVDGEITTIVDGETIMVGEKGECLKDDVRLISFIKIQFIKIE